MRLFAAISLPENVRTSLLLLQAGIPGARWQTSEQLHLTLRFIGEVDGRDAAAIDDALAAISSPSFTLALKGIGVFGGRQPRAVWAGVSEGEAVIHLQRKIESALQRIGLPAEERKFTPHVTLAKLKGSPHGKVIEFLAGHSLYASPTFEVGSFVLYSSTLSPNGSLYRPEQVYPLRTSAQSSS